MTDNTNENFENENINNNNEDSATREEFERINEINNNGEERFSHSYEAEKKIDSYVNDTEEQINRLKEEARREEFERRNFERNNRQTYGNYDYNQSNFNNDNKQGNRQSRRHKKSSDNKDGFWKRTAKYCTVALCVGATASVGFQATNHIGNAMFPVNKSAVESEHKGDDKQLGAPVATEKYVVLSDVSQIIEQNKPSMVSISAITTEQMQNFFSGNYYREVPVSGSGFIISEDKDNLYIATNNHVVEGGKNVSVSFIGDNVAPAKVKGTDPYNDLAVVSVAKKDLPAGTYDKIKVASLGDSNNLTEGQPVVAMGNALGFGLSTTNGIVSALHRTITTEDGNKMEDLIQTNAAINPGNSGGALLDGAGRVIGINTIKTASTEIEGMGYAIPITKAEPILKNILDTSNGEVSEKDRGMLGIKGIPISQSVHENLSIPLGFYVREVVPGSGADKAGIKKGDVIVEINGFTIHNQQDILNRIKYFKAGEKTPVKIMKLENNEYVEKTLTVELTKRTPDVKESQDNGQQAQPVQPNQAPQLPDFGSDNDSDGFGSIFGFPWN